MDLNKHFALITGGCKGIGRAIAEELAKNGNNILLISNDEHCLQIAERELKENYRIECYYFCIDLLDEDSCEAVFEWVNEQQFQISTLVNNVGVGKGGFFSNMNKKDIQIMIHLNCRVMTELCHYFIPMLKEYNPANILNISSIESTLPLPYKAVYTGTKNYVYAFSLALRQELKPYSVGVTAVCPGPVVTNEEGMQRMEAHGARAKILTLLPEDVAKDAVRAMRKNKDVVVPGVVNHVIFRLGGLLPRQLKMNLLNRLFSVYKD